MGFLVLSFIKQLAVFIGCFALAVQAIGQVDTNNASPTLDRRLPRYGILSIDSTLARISGYLKPQQPLLVMYFSPTCGHCQ